MPFTDLVRQASRHRVRSFDGIEIAALSWPGDGDTIVFVHATGFHKEMWAPVVAVLRASGVEATLVSVDMRGHGESGKPAALSWWDYGRDVAAVMEALGTGGAAVGVGHSMGGGAILGAEILGPGTFDGIVLADPAAMSQEFLDEQERRFGNPWADGAVRRRSRYASFEEALDNFRSKDVFSGWVDGAVELYAAHGLEEAEGGVVLRCSPAWEATTFSCSDMVEVWPRIPEVACPITLVTGQHSVTHEPDHARSSAIHLRARHVRLPGIGHFIPMEAPDWTAIEVQRGAQGRQAMMDAGAYEDHHGFVWEYGRDVLAVLDPQTGEQILDLGCGGGQLTARIAESGATVTGVDLDAALIKLARERYPGIRWIEADISDLALVESFDAVFSNAVLHWPPDPKRVATVVADHLRSGGRFVAEFGGATNCDRLIRAIKAAHPDPALEHPWYFPTEQQYANVLEEAGLEPRAMTTFRRPTRLEGGPSGWVRAFGSWATAGVDDVEAFLRDVESKARDEVWMGDHWEGDYVRLRVEARKV